MPNQAQQAQAGKPNYRGSPLEARNAALRRASMLGALLMYAKGNGLEHLQASGRLLTVQDYCQSGVQSSVQADKGREPHLLLPDPYNPGELRLEPIYDCRVEWREAGTGKCWIDVHAGELLVDSSTAVYWQ